MEYCVLYWCEAFNSNKRRGKKQEMGRVGCSRMMENCLLKLLITNESFPTCPPYPQGKLTNCTNWTFENNNCSQCIMVHGGKKNMHMYACAHRSRHWLTDARTHTKWGQRTLLKSRPVGHFISATLNQRIMKSQSTYFQHNLFQPLHSMYQNLLWMTTTFHRQPGRVWSCVRGRSSATCSSDPTGKMDKTDLLLALWERMHQSTWLKLLSYTSSAVFWVQEQKPNTNQIIYLTRWELMYIWTSSSSYLREQKTKTNKNKNESHTLNNCQSCKSKALNNDTLLTRQKHTWPVWI